MKKKIKENGEVLILTSNFRSAKAIGDYVDQCFESKFLTEDCDAPVQATFANMNTVHPNPVDLHGVYTISHPKVPRHKHSEISDLDSDKIASFIAWACQGNLKIQDKDHHNQSITRHAEPGDFLILLKHKKYLHVYAEKLAQYGILSDISGSNTRYEELLALVQLVKCLNDYQDQIALLAVLRGMFFGCSDDELYKYKRAFIHISTSNLPNEETLTDELKPVYQVLVKLKQYQRWVKQIPALTAFMKIIEDIGLLPYSVVQYSGLIRAGTLVQIIDQVQAEPFAAASWNDLTVLLTSLLEAEQKNGVEGTGLFLGSSQAVRIMNLHKAKGLEAPVVFLAEPFGESEHPPKEHIDRMGAEPIGYFAIDQEKKLIAEPVGWVEKANIEIDYMQAEKDRLLYVAATRPKQLLIISCYPTKPSLSPWEELSNPLHKDRELEWEEKFPEDKESLEAAPDLTGLLKDWNAWKERAAQTTYTKTNVTAITKAETNPTLPRSKQGKGPVFGTVVHRCMEEIGKGRLGAKDSLQQLVALIAEEAGLDDCYHSEAIDSISAILASDVWKRGQQAKRRYHEFSLLLNKENEQIEGVIDFLFEEDDGWVIVDFKTDTFGEANQSAFVDFYRPQVQLYSKEWEETFQYHVKEKGIFFTTLQKYVVI